MIEGIYQIRQGISSDANLKKYLIPGLESILKGRDV
jgi:hypothetical protein